MMKTEKEMNYPIGFQRGYKEFLSQHLLKAVGKEIWIVQVDLFSASFNG